MCVGEFDGVLLPVVLTGAAELDGVALTDTLTEAGLVGAAVDVGATVASEVRAPVRE